MDFTHFNPQSQKEEDFLVNFVARRGMLDYFLRQLRLLEPTRPATHHLIVAPRGYGKTSLLRRIAIAVRTEPDLRSRLIALSFREEQHNVISLDIFWRNCLQSLLEVREDERATEDEIERLDAAWTRHAPRQALKRDDQDGEPVKQAFNTHCERLGRRPLLLIDNLDALLAGLPANHQWSLRNDLQSAGGPILLAAASRYPESTHDQKAAFYDFFRIQTLDKLDDKEVMYCLRIRAENRGEAGKKVLDLIECSPGRVAALNTLAGGNPRTLGVLYSVLESHASADVLSQLSAMLDTFTGWYQARTEELPIQSRAVFDALALNWDPMTAAALGEATGLDTTMVSSQLSRLEKSGYVETVSLSGRKKGRNGYQVSERFFNIWYLMRNGPRRARQSIKFLAVFLQSCFSPRERHSIARAVLQDGQADPGYALALASGLRQSQLRNQLIEHADIQSMRLGSAEEYGAAIQDLRSIDVNRKIVIEAEQTTSPSKSIRTMARLTDSKEPASRVEVARTLFNKGVRLGQLGKGEDEIQVYDDLVERFGEATEAALREAVARALVNKGVALGQLGKAEDAIKVYDDLVERFGADTEAALREAVTRALVNKGGRLGQLGKAEDAIKVYDDLVERFGEATEAALRDQVAWALFNKGVRLGQLGKSEDAIKVYDDLVERFGEATEAALRDQVARALFNKGVRVDQLGKAEDAIKVYDDLVERFGEATEAALREQVARALVNKGIRLGQLGRSEDEVQVYDDLVERFGEATEAALREQVALALNSLGNLFLEEQGTPMRALLAFEDGLATNPSPVTKQMLHSNYAYALALHTENLPMALAQVTHALAYEEGISLSGRDLLNALSSLGEPPIARWQFMFEHIGVAVEREDELLWTNYLDDLQRLLWYVVAHGQGNALRQSMEARQYPMKFAPLYHAFVAAIEGEDHLLKINPETRQAAMRIYEGLARRLKLYPRP
ncbi:MAG: tetratricopeptide repeat protein [Candidatus Accumulibacter sp.]|uniref:Tetratricopeptide repeat protein n=1 Tax=Candidatus Accumulibacter proximus TaxID=2954385 RepID=A0A935UIC0_9PROT|nr:tetratricopeptide repeat protein [Candidatus Accumulibacter proximus]